MSLRIYDHYAESDRRRVRENRKIVVFGFVMYGLGFLAAWGIWG